MRITPDTDLDADDIRVDSDATASDTADGGGDTRRTHRRTTSHRQHRLQRNARRLTKSWALTLAVDPSHRTAHINMDGDTPHIVISGRTFPQPVTDYDPDTWDWLCQRVLTAHESGHDRYTDHDDFTTRLDDVPTQYKAVAKHVWNALEDGAIERQLRKRWPNFSTPFLHFRANLFAATDPGRPADDGTGRHLTLADALVTACLDHTTFDSGTTRRLLDPADDSYQFASDEDRQRFLRLFLALTDTVDDVLTEPDAVARNARIFDFIDRILDVLPEADDAGADEMADADTGPGGMPDDTANRTSAGTDDAGELDGDFDAAVGSNSDGDDTEAGAEKTTDDGDTTGGGEATDQSESDRLDGDTEADSPGGETGDSNDAEPDTEAEGDATDATDSDTPADEETAEKPGRGHDKDISHDPPDGADRGQEESTPADSDPTDDTETAPDDTTEGAADNPETAQSDDDDTDSPATGEHGDTTPSRALGSIDDIETDDDLQDELAADLDREQQAARPEQDQHDADTDALADELNALADALTSGSEDLELTSLSYIDDATMGGNPTVWDDADQMATRVKHLLPLEDETETDTTRHQRRGYIDSAAVHRIATGDDHIHTQRTRPDKPDINIILVLDRSTSMSGDTVQTAETALLSFALALEAHDVNVMVVELYKNRVRVASAFADRLDQRRAALTHGNTAGTTPLSDALILARERLHLEREGLNRLIVVTDGEPNDDDRYEDALDQCGFPVTGINIRPDGDDNATGTEYYHRSVAAAPDGSDLQQSLLHIARELLPTNTKR